MDNKIEKLEDQMTEVQSEIKIMNLTLKHIAQAINKTDELNKKFHDMEIRFAIDDSKIKNSERVVWIAITAMVTFATQFLK